ncbi:MAG: hypothetical protein IIC24_03525 [Chloroflexi bacterium]|nr:hypothetical protein [Chloroflexota bacterium]
MSDVIPAMLAIILFVVTLVTISSTVITAADEIRQAMAAQEARSLPQIDTEINTSPQPISFQATSTFELTLINKGNTSIGDFSNWDVIAEIQQATTTSITYMTYTTSTSPSANEWTLLGIYNNVASTPKFAETFSPGILDPGESMVALLNPSPSVVSNTYDRVTFVTPTGVTAKVIFEILPDLLYIVDATDAVVYAYRNTGPFYLSYALDSNNSDATGITTKGQGFWTTDIVDDLMYKYTTSFAITSTSTLEAFNQNISGITTDGTNIWTVDNNDRKLYKYDINGNYISKTNLNAANRDPSGVTTDGTNIWVLDEDDDTAYRYDMSGTFVDSFALTAANADAFGITTNGTDIWVVDVVDAAVYKYDMTGSFDSSFTLTAANADPQGITMITR